MIAEKFIGVLGSAELFGSTDFRAHNSTLNKPEKFPEALHETKQRVYIMFLLHLSQQ